MVVKGLQSRNRNYSFFLRKIPDQVRNDTAPNTVIPAKAGILLKYIEKSTDNQKHFQINPLNLD
jgi:hypothetical protein